MVTSESLAKLKGLLNIIRTVAVESADGPPGGYHWVGVLGVHPPN